MYDGGRVWKSTKLMGVIYYLWMPFANIEYVQICNITQVPTHLWQPSSSCFKLSRPCESSVALAATLRQIFNCHTLSLSEWVRSTFLVWSVHFQCRPYEINTRVSKSLKTHVSIIAFPRKRLFFPRLLLWKSPSPSLLWPYERMPTCARLYFPGTC